MEVLQGIVYMLGRGYPRPSHLKLQSPEMDPAKTKPPRPSNTALGVVVDLSHTSSPHEPRVLFSVNQSRVETVLSEFWDAYRAGILTPHHASRLRGKLFFCLSAAYGMVGRAATLPLVQRQYRDSRHDFHDGSELHHTLLFFDALLPNLPPLVVPLEPPRVAPLLVYTDASFWREKRGRDECTDAHARLRGALGAVVFDPESGEVRYAHALPPWDILLSSWRTDRKTYIAELEALAAISVYTTYPSLFAGRRVNHFIDNTVALSAIVHGYSGKPELAKAVNVFYLQMISLRASVYFDYVPSKANIADLPSREYFSQLRAELLGLSPPDSSDPLVVPSVSSWASPLVSWATRDDTAHMRVPV